MREYISYEKNSKEDCEKDTSTPQRMCSMQTSICLEKEMEKRVG